MLVKNIEILKKPYFPPRIIFEELEDDGVELLKPSQDDASGGDYEGGEGDEDPDALDLDFSMDFVVNDEPQL